MTRRWRTLLLCIACGTVLACAAKVAPRVAGTEPKDDTDEAGLWLVTDRSEQRTKTSPLLERSPEINRYVREIVCRVAGEHCRDIRVYVLNIPYFNATMAPNGAMEVWSGLLLRAENEAQAAFVIGHEIAHFVERHGLERWRTSRKTATAAMVFSIGVNAAGVPLLGDLGYLAAMGRIYGFSREQEREADELGCTTMIRAGYDGRECARIWRYLVEEVEHSDVEEKRRRQARASIFNTHPLTSERIAFLEELAATEPEAETGFERYRAIVSPHLEDWLRDEVRLRDFGQSLFLIDRLIGYGDRLGTLYYYRGEAYRMRRKEGDDARALEAYEQAAAYEDAPAEVWRALGQAYRARGKREKARHALHAYLDALPDASDRLLIESYLADLGAQPTGETTP